jgi:hypothetical protein
MVDLRERLAADPGNARNLDPASRTDATALPLPCLYRTGSNYRPLLDLRRFRCPVEAILINDFALRGARERDVRLASKADIPRGLRDVRFTPKSGHPHTTHN